MLDMGEKNHSGDARSAALGALNEARLARESAERDERTALREARSAGASWARIGELYGLTKQGAQQRFKRNATSTVDDAVRD